MLDITSSWEGFVTFLRESLPLFLAEVLLSNRPGCSCLRYILFPTYFFPKSPHADFRHTILSEHLAFQHLARWQNAYVTYFYTLDLLHPSVTSLDSLLLSSHMPLHSSHGADKITTPCRSSDTHPQ